MLCMSDWMDPVCFPSASGYCLCSCQGWGGLCLKKIETVLCQSNLARLSYLTKSCIIFRLRHLKNSVCCAVAVLEVSASVKTLSTLNNNLAAKRLEQMFSGFAFRPASVTLSLFHTILGIQDAVFVL